MFNHTLTLWIYYLLVGFFLFFFCLFTEAYCYFDIIKLVKISLSSDSVCSSVAVKIQQKWVCEGSGEMSAHEWEGNKWWASKVGLIMISCGFLSEYYSEADENVLGKIRINSQKSKHFYLKDKIDLLFIVNILVKKKNQSCIWLVFRKS